MYHAFRERICWQEKFFTPSVSIYYKSEVWCSWRWWHLRCYQTLRGEICLTGWATNSLIMLNFYHEYMVQNKVNTQTPLFRRWIFFGSWCSGGNFWGSDQYENSYIQNWALGGHFFVKKIHLRMIFLPHALCANMGGENYTKNIMYLWIEIAQLIKGLQ